MRLQPPLTRDQIDAQARASRLSNLSRELAGLSAVDRDILLAPYRTLNGAGFNAGSAMVKAL